MTARLAVILAVALPCILGAHLSALLLGAFAVLVVTAHLLPIIAAVAIVGAVLILPARIALTIRQTGFICARSFA
jgi:hypothetical protein